MPTEQKKNYIAYSLWGSDPLYNTGILHNIAQATALYPDWQVVVCYDDSVPAVTINNIRQAGAQTVQITNGVYGMFWRFYVADFEDCGHVIFRDSDSRLSLRERAAVEEWIRQDSAIHIMRDHPYHQHLIDGKHYHILGGMWGIKGGLLNMTELVNDFALGKQLNYGSDQFFLNYIYDRLGDSATIHDEIFSSLKFPVKRENYRFIGERFDENDQPDPNTWKVLREHYRTQTVWWPLIKKVKRILRNLLK